jgi:isoaspartyl peptidase/L-asparaginase-like protein (Ntn-hydrolase superfamily)
MSSAQVPAEKQPPTLAPHNVVAVFPGMQQAREAIDALERGGIDAAEVSLLGPAAEEAAEHLDTRDRDAGMAERVGSRATVGAVAGGATGGLAGFLAGLAAFAIPGVGPVLGAGVWAATIGGAVAGGSVGGVIGGYSALDMNEAYELTFESVRAGRVVVGVHSEDPANVQKGEEILRKLDPLGVDRFEASGRRVHND